MPKVDDGEYGGDEFTRMATPPTMINWLGSKRKLTQLFEPYIPRNIANYYEAFLGGGSMFLHMLSTHRFARATLVDISDDIINLWRYIQSGKDLSEFVADYHRLVEDNNKERFMTWRDIDPSGLSPRDLALRFLYLNNSCFNCTIQYDREGNITSAYSNRAARKVTISQLLDIRTLLRRAVFVQDDYRVVVDLAGRYDFVYLDPPYHYIREDRKKAYISYTKDDFDQDDLLAFCDELTDKGVRWMQSNSDSAWVYEAYGRYNIVKVDDTNKAKEVFIMNYAIGPRQKELIPCRG